MKKTDRLRYLKWGWEETKYFERYILFEIRVICLLQQKGKQVKIRKENFHHSQFRFRHIRRINFFFISFHFLSHSIIIHIFVWSLYLCHRRWCIIDKSYNNFVPGCCTRKSNYGWPNAVLHSKDETVHGLVINVQIKIIKKWRSCFVELHMAFNFKEMEGPKNAPEIF